ncbi:FG-nucleoporin NUP42 [Nakaseomyces bracarensis]|uniref:FG-nucleoporin NUP42 n=1 Tax=Nakaseomyces bracarensis TaxID=273131 RepID=UPI0038713E8D
MSSRIPCKFFQQGNCRRGNSCKFGHFISNSNNNYNNTTNNNNNTNDPFSQFISPVSISKHSQVILDDMKECATYSMKPLTSSYSLSDPCAVNLIQDRDLSPEESRYKYYEAQKTQTLPSYIQEMEARSADIQKCVREVSMHPDIAVRFLQKCTQDIKELGHRTIQHEFIKFPISMTGDTNSNNNAFGGSNNSNNSTGMFGISGFSNTNNNGVANSAGVGGAFGKPSFGGSNAAGGSSPFGTAAAPTASGAFGKPSFGSSGTGQSAFGAPAFGSSGFGSSGFGSLAQGTNTSSSPFGASSAAQQNPFTKVNNNIGAGANASPFGNNTATNTGASPFGSLNSGSSPAASSPFGKSLFGATAGNTNTTSAFGKPAFGQGQNTQQSPFGSATNSTFGTASTQQNPFNSTSNTNNSAFGATTGANANTNNSFGSKQSPFGTNNTTQSPFVTNNTTQSPFGTNNTAKSPFGTATNTNTAFGGNTTNSPFNSLKPDNSTGGQSNPNGFRSVQNPSGQVGAQMSSPFGTNTAGFGSNQGNSSFGASASTQPMANTQTASSSGFIQGLPSEETEVNVSDLSPDTIQVFKARTFQLGMVPDIAPPTALIN